MSRSVVLAIIAGVALTAAGSGQAAARTCTLGTSNAADLHAARRIIGGQTRGFERSLAGISASHRRAAGATFAAAVAAYLYGFPQVMMQRTIDSYPVNVMVSIGKLADTSTVTVVAPNHDTLYSVAQLDLTRGPIVVQTPPTAGRYSVIQLIDVFTNVAGYVGDGSRGRTGDAALVVPPGWRGSVPAGVRVIRPASPSLWLLGRTVATGRADTASAVALLARYSLTPLADYEAGKRRGSLVLPDFPAGRKPIMAPTGTAFFDELGADLAADPAPRADACALARFASVGIGPRMTASTATGLRGRALRAAAAAGPRVLTSFSAAARHQPGRQVNGWATTPHDIARFRTDYLTRALIAQIGLGVNTIEKALYPIADRDSRGRPLTGAHDYVVHFAPGQLPPVRQFWSLTLYDKRILFYPNRLQRFAVGDRTPGLRRDARGGGLTIYLSNRDPGAARRSNWLPAPRQRFSLYLRLYEPRPAASTNRWRPPSIRRIRALRPKLMGA
ncbi:MAG: DUF1254 domain-containing protein [Solirubrobacteraceae bacterium]